MKFPDDYINAVPVKPYHVEEAGVIWCADCRDILPHLPKVDLVLTDPPYGIGKASWDKNFDLGWLNDIALTDTVAIIPGVWNIVNMPAKYNNLHYKWTLSAHLINGMTKGGLGWGNWIPCVVYQRKIKKPQPQYVQDWCRSFAIWCQSEKITKNKLDQICGTSDMGGWYLGLLPHRCQIPAPHQWQKIVNALTPPKALNPQWVKSDYRPQTDCRAFVIGTEPKPNHPCPKPLNVVKWFIEAIGGDIILDPFLGSGTMAVAAKELGRKFIGIEISEAYCKIAVKRLRQGVFNFQEITTELRE